MVPGEAREGAAILNPEEVGLHLVTCVDEAVDLMSWLSRRRPTAIAVDTETGGLRWWRDPLRMVQFGDGDTGWAVPWEEWSGLAKEVFRRYDGDLVMHNAIFDLRYLERNGCQVKRKRVHDTKIMAHLVDPTALTALKPLGVRYVNPLLAHLQDDLKGQFARNKWTWATVPWDYGPYWSYAALDTVITANLHEALKPLAKPYERAYELEVASEQVVMDLVTHGVRLDVGYCERKLDELEAFVAAMGKHIKDTYGCGLGNRDVAAQFLRDGVALTRRTPTGEWCLDKEVLDGIDHPLARDIAERRHAQKVASTYFRNFLELRDGDLLHPDINPLGARTSRMSVNTPAMQQIPRGRLVRDAFVAGAGQVLVDVDFNQEEQRLIAHYTGDPGLAAAFAAADAGGVDFLTGIAREIYGDPAMAKEDDRRQTTKNIVYARGYGAGPDRLMQQFRLTQEQVAEFLQAYDARFPLVRKWERGVEQVAQQRLRDEGEAYVTTPWGRRLPARSDEDTYTLVNYLIQGTASDVLKQRLVDLDLAGLARYAVLPVHDELLFEVPAEDADEVTPAIVDVMREETMFAVPLTCGASVGRTWGEVH